MMETSARIEAQGETLEQGYKACRKQVKKDLKPWSWLISNVGGDNKKVPKRSTKTWPTPWPANSHLLNSPHWLILASVTTLTRNVSSTR